MNSFMNLTTHLAGATSTLQRLLILFSSDAKLDFGSTVLYPFLCSGIKKTIQHTPITAEMNLFTYHLKRHLHNTDIKLSFAV